MKAERDKRAGDRAVACWARENSATLRRLAGKVSAVEDLDAAAQQRVHQVEAALGDDDPATLLPPLALAQADLEDGHSALAEQLTAVTEHTDRLRRDAIVDRRGEPG